MIILFTAGQLGNQVFQYGFADSIRNEYEKIVTSKCDYFDVFEYKQDDYIFLNKYIRFILRRILDIFVKLRLVSSVLQNRELINNYLVDVDSYTYKRGLFSFVKVVNGFFQSSKFINNTPKIKYEYIKKADEYLDNIPKDMQMVFVHIRRGDYLEWSILDKKNPSLPFSYYKAAIEQLESQLDNPFFVFLSNDSKYVEQEFGYIENKKVSKNKVGVDIAIMMSCENAVVSSSTLSWWGVNLIKTRNRIIAPKYWLGWQSEIWYPKGIELDFVEYIDVKK